MKKFDDKYQKLANDILILSRNTLLVNLRFLDMALSQFEYVPIEKLTMLTDGKHLFYNPKYILKNYKNEKETSVRDYLHIVMHCIFRHMYVNSSLNSVYWDLACDIAVENTITDLNIKAVTAKREDEQQKFIKELKINVEHLTAEKIYKYLTTENISEEKIDVLSKIFQADDHITWYDSLEKIRDKFKLSQNDNLSNGQINKVDNNDKTFKLSSENKKK